MDTELLILAEKLGYRIYDLPVRRVDDPDRRVKLWRTAVGDIKGLIRVKDEFGGVSLPLVALDQNPQFPANGTAKQS